MQLGLLCASLLLACTGATVDTIDNDGSIEATDAALPAASRACHDLLRHVETRRPDWPTLSHCVVLVGSETLDSNASLSVWRHVKKLFTAVENVPRSAYTKLGYVLTALPIDDIHNISVDSVDIVEALGRVRNAGPLRGFRSEQLQLIAAKMRTEWVDKTSDTYSAYDLRVMGPIVCYLEQEDIANLHANAFIDAVSYMGDDDFDCLQVEALANRAKQSDVFGAPANWTKYTVSAVGNIITGLSAAERDEMDPQKLIMNTKYRSALEAALEAKRKLANETNTSTLN